MDGEEDMMEDGRKNILCKRKRKRERGGRKRERERSGRGRDEEKDRVVDDGDIEVEVV